MEKTNKQKQTKKNYGIKKTIHADFGKGSYHKFITFLLTFYTAYFITFMSHFHFVLEFILKQAYLLLQFFNPVGKRQK